MNKLRIGILTFHFSENFGALLQAYALRKWLTDQGHSAEFIDYHPAHVEGGGSFHRLWDPKAVKANAKIAYLKLSVLRQKLFGNRQQAAAFEAFRHDALNVAPPSLPTPQDVGRHLQTMENPYDLIVLGSDQIWAASQQHGLDKAYFADFATAPGTRRISYAPSFGKASIEAGDRAELKRMLAALDGISCRERSGVAIVEELLGKNVPCVPDPTLLLGDFSSLISETAGQTGHVFCYALRSGDGIRQVADWVGERLGAEVVSPYNAHRRWAEIGRTIHPSPAEWIGLVDRAAFVVTNSFHGTVFSILLRKPFLVPGLPGKRSSLNERALNLLDELGLRDRFIENGDLASARMRFEMPIGWDAAHQKLHALQSAGRDYLNRELALCMRSA